MVVPVAYDGRADGGWAVREQGVLAHLPEEELQSRRPLSPLGASFKAVTPQITWVSPGSSQAVASQAPGWTTAARR